MILLDDTEFLKFPKIKRLKRSCVITEKLDGTNAQILFEGDGNMYCGSRNRWVIPGQDNYGFATWAYAYKEELFDVLGVGRHYGEWWGSGIQRNYGLDGKRFSLFNTGRWGDKDLGAVARLGVVPILYAGDFSSEVVDETMEHLEGCSVASPGFDSPEGIVVYHSQINQMFKVTFEHDKTGKPLV